MPPGTPQRASPQATGGRGTNRGTGQANLGRGQPSAPAPAPVRSAHSTSHSNTSNPPAQNTRSSSRSVQRGQTGPVPSNPGPSNPNVGSIFAPSSSSSRNVASPPSSSNPFQPVAAPAATYPPPSPSSLALLQSHSRGRAPTPIPSLAREQDITEFGLEPIQQGSASELRAPLRVDIAQDRPPSRHSSTATVSPEKQQSGSLPQSELGQPSRSTTVVSDPGSELTSYSYDEDGQVRRRVTEEETAPAFWGAGSRRHLATRHIGHDFSLELDTFILAHFNKVIKLRNEPIHASVANFHATWNPVEREYDPLLPFGAVNGLMPGRDHFDSDLLRDAVIRWAYPITTDSPFDDTPNVKDYMSQFRHINFSFDNITELYYDRKQDEVVLWTTGFKVLSPVTHLSLALNQILATLAYYVDPNRKQNFVFDPHFKFTRMVEACDNPDVLMATLHCLQQRSIQAKRHIEDYFRFIKAGVGIFDVQEESERSASALSSRPSIREQFGTEDGPVEIGKLLQRPLYSSTIENAEQLARDLTSHLSTQGQEPRKQDNYYLPSRFARHARSGSFPPKDEITSSISAALSRQYEENSRIWEVSASELRDSQPTAAPSRTQYGVRFDEDSSAQQLRGLQRNALPNQGQRSVEPPLSLSTAFAHRTVENLPGIGPISALTTNRSSRNEGMTMAEAARSFPGQIPTHRVPGILPFPSSAPPPKSHTAHLYSYVTQNSAQDSTPIADNWGGRQYREPPEQQGVGGFPTQGVRPPYVPEGGGLDGFGGKPPVGQGGVPSGGGGFGGGGPGGPGGGGPSGGGGPGGFGGHGGGPGYPGGGGPGGGGGGGGGPPNPGGGGGGPPNPGGGGGGPPNPGGPGAPHAAPYQPPNPFAWQFNPKINLSEIPEWDGEGNTLTEYLIQMQDLASKSNEIAVGLAVWAPARFKGEAKEWWRLLTQPIRDYYSTTWLNLFEGIRGYFMDRKWVEDRQMEYDQMYFRNKGHRDETPLAYIERRKHYATFLFPVGAVHEEHIFVRHILSKMPSSWVPHINNQICPTVYSLIQLTKVISPTLITVWKQEKINDKIEAIGEETLLALARKKYGRRAYKSANQALGQLLEDLEDEDLLSDDEETNPPEAKEGNAAGTTRSNDPKRSRSRPAWPEKPVFPKDDATLSKKPPPGVCYICGSANHYARDCKHYGKWLTLKNANMLQVDISQEDIDEQDQLYSVVCLAQSDSVRVSTSSELSDSAKRRDGALIAHVESPSETETSRESSSDSDSELRDGAQIAHEVRVGLTSCMVHSNDGSEIQVQDGMGTAYVSSMSVDKDRDGARIAHGQDSPRRRYNLDNRNTRRRIKHEKKGKEREAGGQAERVIPRKQARKRKDSRPYPSSLRTIDGNDVEYIYKRRSLPEGMGPLGTKALHFKAKVHSLDNEAIEARLDSGADITLLSEDYWKTIPELGKPKQGLRMTLYHLTGEAKVLGYVVFPLFAETTDGSYVCFETEAYVVKNMKVPLLVGEDFQTAYELGVHREASGNCRVTMPRSSRVIPASTAQDVELGFDVRKAFAGQSFVRAKTYQRAKAKSRRTPEQDTSVLAVDDVIVKAGSVHNIRVSGPFEGREDWLVERMVIGTSESFVMASPTTWISSDDPMIPVANPSSRPLFIKAGDLVGHIVDPSSMDNPTSDLELRKYTLAVDLIKTQIRGTLKAQDLAAGKPSPESEDDVSDEEVEELLGPKTSAVADDLLPKRNDTSDISKLVNLGPDIPAHILPRLENVLRKHERAFGVDGRLGNYPAQVPVPLKPDSQPVSLPMYAASPLKREVIEKQVKAWLEAEVIEPSVSPWGFPVVVVFQKGKPRFAVDYRKLNTQTVSDEFPIPRQSDIIQALSGSQVLSSFDALAGFTQIHMSEDAKPKTAFRCHLGLFQFKRMPFGLKNGPSVFQRIMQSVLAPFLWIFTLVYIDDIVVFSKSWEDHLVHLDSVLGSIAKSGLTLAPSKCYVGFASILLLGQKVSRLGLSTHAQKVAAIQELDRPKTVHDLQKFLGMVVYFSSYIPHYAFIAAPLFGLLKQGVKWRWEADHEIAFQEAKNALASAPVLGHPQQGRPYRLYTDASDLALGSCLQQIQRMQVRDLVGTTAYDKVRTAWERKESHPPPLTQSLTDDVVETIDDSWAENLDDTWVHVERVIAYWSRTFKSAERRYSATEREALAAKEALVRFQPFIEGETIILVTDHAALQWARVYENANRRLAAWGAVFAAYPKLKIVHRAGRIHSNVDPISRLPRVPQHVSPLPDTSPGIVPDQDTQAQAQAAEDKGTFAPARKAAFVVDWEDVIELHGGAVNTRSRTKAMTDQTRKKRTDSTSGKKTSKDPSGALIAPPDLLVPSGATTAPLDESHTILPFPLEDHWTYPIGTKGNDFELDALDEDWSKHSQLLVAASPESIEGFAKGYEADRTFKQYYLESAANPETLLTPSHFRKGSQGLLYFIDADWRTRLCVPESKVPYVLNWIHNSPNESAHAGKVKFISRLQELFYWPKMRKDAEEFVKTCDVCQKTKVDRRGPTGGLRPAHIPSRPFETVSMDLITGLPPSGEEQFTAVLVIVDKLSKFAIITPTFNELDQEGFAKIFVEKVVHVFGLPSRIISDRDKRWATAFWKSVVSRYGSVMALSSSHHPQTDGQTEILNANIEQMLRAYVAEDRSSWAQWISTLAFAYNSNVHSSTGYRPDFLLFGYLPQSIANLIIPANDVTGRPFLASQKAEHFTSALESHRKFARDALTMAQERQAKAYNKGRRPVEEFKEGDWALINPHTLKLVETEGTGKKLVQRTIGPFEVMEKVNPLVYRLRLPDNYPMHPVINISHLKKYHFSPPRFGERITLPQTRDFLDASDEYEVEAILGHRLSSKKHGNQRMYLIRWRGFDPSEDSWISEFALRNAPELKREYHHMMKLT